MRDVTEGDSHLLVFVRCLVGLTGGGGCRTTNGQPDPW